MGKTRSTIDEAARTFIAAQKIFFVATAPLDPDGHVNLSPKGLDTFRILSPSTAAYLDFNGSGVETIAHLKENGRGRAVEPHHAEFAALAADFPPQEHFRSVIVIDVDRVTDSCGYGVPLYQYEGERDQLQRWGKKQSADGLKAYRERKNRHSIDGLPGLLETDHQEEIV